MSSIDVEECFADNNVNDIQSNTKIYATLSTTTTKNQLIEENLNQIVNKKETFSNKLEERIHYLTLELANKELELIEANSKLEEQNKIINLLNRFETAFESIQNNRIKYAKIIDMLENKSNVKHIEAVEKFVEVSKNSPITLNYESSILPVNVQYLLLGTYHEKYVEECNLKEKVQSLLFDYNENYYKSILNMIMGAIITNILYALYVMYR